MYYVYYFFNIDANLKVDIPEGQVKKINCGKGEVLDINEASYGKKPTCLKSTLDKIEGR